MLSDSVAESSASVVHNVWALWGAILSAAGTFLAGYAASQKRRYRLWLISLAVLMLVGTLGLFIWAFYDSLKEIWSNHVWLGLCNFYEAHPFALGAISGLAMGVLLYWLFMCIIMRRCSVHVLPDVLEQWMDVAAGHRRFKIVRRFPSYCNTCRHMVWRAARGWGTGGGRVMYTVQTPVWSEGLGEKEARAYQRYVGTTIRVLLTESWVYARLVYLSSDPKEFGRSFARSFEFCRSFVYEYFFGCKSGQDAAEVEHLVPRLPKHYPYGMAHKARRSLGGELNPGDVKIGYTAEMAGLLDTVSRLDLHLPPSREFSIAFTGPSGNGDFVGCLRVREPGDWLADQARRMRILKEDSPEVRQKLVGLFNGEWVRIENAEALVHCMGLINDFAGGTGGVVPFFRRDQRGEIANRWHAKECDRLIFLSLLIAAAKAVWAVKGKLDEDPSRRPTWQQFAEAAVAAVEDRWASLIVGRAGSTLLGIDGYEDDAGRRGVDAVAALIQEEVGDLSAP